MLESLFNKEIYEKFTKILLKRDSNGSVSYKICEFFKKTYFEEHLWTTAYASWKFSLFSNLCQSSLGLQGVLLDLNIPIPDKVKKLSWIFIFTLKGLHKTFWGTTKKCENKDLTQFLFEDSFQKWTDL